VVEIVKTEEILEIEEIEILGSEDA
jgi:hypothetical protein